MDALTHCKAMEAFCRQRAKIENEAAGFWLNEAQLWRERVAALAAQANPVDKSSQETATKVRRVAS